MQVVSFLLLSLVVAISAAATVTSEIHCDKNVVSVSDVTFVLSVETHVVHVFGFNAVLKVKAEQQAEIFTKLVNHIETGFGGWSVTQLRTWTFVVDNQADGRRDYTEFHRSLVEIRDRARAQLCKSYHFQFEKYGVSDVILHCNTQTGTVDRETPTNHRMLGGLPLAATSSIARDTQFAMRDELINKFRTGFGGYTVEQLKTFKYKVAWTTLGLVGYDRLLEYIGEVLNGATYAGTKTEGNGKGPGHPTTKLRYQIAYINPDGKHGKTNWSPWIPFGSTDDVWQAHPDASWPAWMKQRELRAQDYWRLRVAAGYNLRNHGYYKP